MAETVTPLNPGAVSGNADDEEKWPMEPENVTANGFDTGVFISELADIRRLPGKLESVNDDEKTAFAENPENLSQKACQQAPPSIEEGTYRGTQLALVKIYDLIEQVLYTGSCSYACLDMANTLDSFSSYMDTANFEPLVPSPLTREQKLKYFAFTTGSDKYPPHLNLAGNVEAAKLEQAENQKSTLAPTEIFSKMRMLQLSSLLPSVLPSYIAVPGRGAAWAMYGSMGTPDKGDKLADVEKFNRDARGRWRFQRKDIFDLPNVGDLKDWYSDARFAQQQFTGTNPTTIELVSDFWLQHFIQAAKAQEDEEAKNTIVDLSHKWRGSLYMQDYSYFREAAELDPTAVVKCEFDDKDKNGKPIKSYRYACASVCLFYLNEKGQLYPLAIVIDWRGSAERSVTIYNRELIKRKDIQSGNDKSTKEKIKKEAEDWPWRYGISSPELHPLHVLLTRWSRSSQDLCAM